MAGRREKMVSYREMLQVSIDVTLRKTPEGKEGFDGHLQDCMAFLTHTKPGKEREG